MAKSLFGNQAPGSAQLPQQDPKDLLEMMVLQDHKGLLATMVLQDHKDLLETPDPQVLQGHKDLREIREA